MCFSSFSIHSSNLLLERMSLWSWKTISGELSSKKIPAKKKRFQNIYFFSICGTLHSVDQFLNIRLTDISKFLIESFEIPNILEKKLLAP